MKNNVAKMVAIAGVAKPLTTQAHSTMASTVHEPTKYRLVRELLNFDRPRMSDADGGSGPTSAAVGASVSRSPSVAVDGVRTGDSETEVESTLRACELRMTPGSSSRANAEAEGDLMRDGKRARR